MRGMADARDFDLEAGTTALYKDPTYYDYEYKDRVADVRWYAERYVEAEGPALELGVGTGRIALRAVREGATVTGVDLSTTMLEQAEARRQSLPKTKRDRLELLQGDMRALDLGRRFALVSCPFNAFMHMYTREDAERCLAVARAHLEPGGVFALDVLMPDLEYLNRPAFKTFAGVRFKHPTFGCHFIYAEQTAYDPVTQLNQMRLMYERSDPDEDGPPSYVVELSHRYFFPRELEALLHANGFRVLMTYGDFELGALHSTSESQVLLCGLR